MNPIILNDKGIRLYTNDDDIQAELEQSYMLFEQYTGDPNYTKWYNNKGNFNPAYHNVMRMVYDNDKVDDIKKTFYFKLLAYIACHLCELLRQYKSDFITRLLTLLETENVTGVFDKDIYADPELNKCLDRLHMPNLSNTELLSVLEKIKNKEPEYTIDKICTKN